VVVVAFSPPVAEQAPIKLTINNPTTRVFMAL